MAELIHERKNGGPALSTSNKSYWKYTNKKIKKWAIRLSAASALIAGLVVGIPYYNSDHAKHEAPSASAQIAKAEAPKPAAIPVKIAAPAAPKQQAQAPPAPVSAKPSPEKAEVPSTQNVRLAGFVSFPPVPLALATVWNVLLVLLLFAALAATLSTPWYTFDRVSRVIAGLVAAVFVAVLLVSNWSSLVSTRTVGTTTTTVTATKTTVTPPAAPVKQAQAPAKPATVPLKPATPTKQVAATPPKAAPAPVVAAPKPAAPATPAPKVAEAPKPTPPKAPGPKVAPAPQTKTAEAKAAESPAQKNTPASKQANGGQGLQQLAPGRYREEPFVNRDELGDPKRANINLAELVQASLIIDPTGNRRIEKTSCTTPNDIYNSVISHNREMNVRGVLESVADLPAFLRVLVYRDARRDAGLTGSFPMSRMRCYSPGTRTANDLLETTDHAREFHPGELVWYHPNFTDPVFAGDCGNVVAKRPSPAPAPAPTPVQTGCYAFHVDGRGNKNVKLPLPTVFEFFRQSHEDFLSLRANDDGCLYAVDGATGKRLKIYRECSTCLVTEQGEVQQQAAWPSDVPVGTATEFIFSVYDTDGKTPGFPSGYGTIYVPMWLAPSVLWCFEAKEPYYGRSPDGDGTWQYFSFYDQVTQQEVRSSKANNDKEFPRTIEPRGRLGM